MQATDSESDFPLSPRRRTARGNDATRGAQLEGTAAVQRGPVCATLSVILSWLSTFTSMKELSLVSSPDAFKIADLETCVRGVSFEILLGNVE